MLTVTIRDDNGQALGIVVLSPKTFSSGKTGFFGVWQKSKSAGSVSSAKRKP